MPRRALLPLRLRGVGLVLDDGREHLLPDVGDDGVLLERRDLLDAQPLLELDVRLDRGDQAQGLLRVGIAHVVERRPAEDVDAAVAHGLDVHGPPRVVEEADLAEVVALGERLREVAPLL